MEKISVETKIGQIQVHEFNEGDINGVKIYLSGELHAMIEVDNNDKELVARLYDQETDEPIITQVLAK